jgi:hypothetical protein
MGNGLENRLRKIEKTVGAQEDEIDSGAWRAMAEKLRSTPEGRALARASAERMVQAMRAKERAQLERMTSPEQLARLRKQWAEEDAREEAMKKRGAECEARLQARARNKDTEVNTVEDEGE